MMTSSKKSTVVVLLLLLLSTLLLICTAFNVHHLSRPSKSSPAIKYIGTTTTYQTSTTHLFLSDSNSNNNNDPNKQQQQQQQKHLSASQQARRDEEKRRQTRRNEGFATPGISSVIPGAQDLPIDIAKTEREYMASLSTSDDDSTIDEYNVDKFVALWTEEGLQHLRMLRLHEASTYFDKVYEIKPDAYLWQDGIVKYYLDDYHGAAESLARNAKRYEKRFMEPASEERIWRDAAELKVISSLNGGRKLLKSVDVPAAMRVEIDHGDDDNDDDGIVDAKTAEMESISSERRKVIRIARQLFSSSLRNDEKGVSLARAQLQACCGDSFPSSLRSTLPTLSNSVSSSSTSSSISPTKDHKMYKLHSFFYLGLHYDALNQSYESKQCMKMALKSCAHSIGGNNADITYLLPVIHMTVRDWYDDDEFDDEEGVGDNSSIDLNDEELMEQLLVDGGVELDLGNDDAATAAADDDSSLRESIKDMKVADLKSELKARKLKVSGSKKELQDRLVDALKKDGGGK